MNPLFQNKKIFMIGGSGGVGKTTFAASIGVKFALQGHRTMVLTVDPARRLAQALGLTTFTGDVQKVEIAGHPEAKLFTTMLDTQRDFDRIIQRFARDEHQRDRILNSKIYRVMVESLGGSHEYAAMERLLEFAKNPEFDRVVIDTPPSQNAVDLFSAPERLAEFMDNSVLKWFQGDNPRFFSFLKQGTRLAMKALEKLFGNEFFQELGKVLQDLDGMQAGFRSRNLEVMETLRSNQTAFLLVSYPSEVRHLEAAEFLKTLKSYSIPVAALVLNRLEPFAPECVPHSVGISEDVRGLVDPVLDYYHALYEEQQIWIKKFEDLMGDKAVYKIQKQVEPLHDVKALGELKGFEV